MAATGAGHKGPSLPASTSTSPSTISQFGFSTPLHAGCDPASTSAPSVSIQAVAIWTPADLSVPNARHRRRHPSDTSVPADDFPHGFHLPSARSVHRRLAALHPAMNSGMMADPMKASTSTVAHKHRQPYTSSFTSESTVVDTNNMASNRIDIAAADDFTATFHSPSRRSVRRRLSADHAGSSSIPQNMVTPCNAHRRTIFSALMLGPPSHTCHYCGPLFWYEERVNRARQTSAPTYNKCCKEGSIVLPPYRPPPEPLHGLLTWVNTSLSVHFFENIRFYNSMFAFTSMGVRVLDSINDGHGPYVFKISGQLCHRIGSLLPTEGQRPEYAQLYIFDTDNEIRNRMNIATNRRGTFCPNQHIVAALIDMFNIHNPIVQLFRTAHDRIIEGTDDRYIIRLFGDPNKHGDIYCAPIASEVVGLVVDDVGASDGGRDLMLEDRAGQMQRV